MPQFVVPDEGERFLLELMMIRPLATGDTMQLGLFTNDITIDGSTVLGDLTPATFDGYALVGLPRDQWTSPATVAERAVTTFTGSPVWFVCTSGSEDVYGWYVTDEAETTLICGARLAGAPVTVDPAHPVPITPIMRLTTEYPPIT